MVYLSKHKPSNRSTIYHLVLEEQFSNGFYVVPLLLYETFGAHPQSF
jgi:hypothetical protein